MIKESAETEYDLRLVAFDNTVMFATTIYWRQKSGTGYRELKRGIS